MRYLKVEVFIPREDGRQLMEILNREGFLEEGNYDFCYSETPVIGHFRPLPGANPYIGTVDRIEDVEETKIEFRILEKDVKSVYQWILKHHPYETPVIHFIPTMEMVD